MDTPPIGVSLNNSFWYAQAVAFMFFSLGIKYDFRLQRKRSVRISTTATEIRFKLFLHEEKPAPIGLMKGDFIQSNKPIDIRFCIAGIACSFLNG
jgi:hypothetical protein